MVHIENGPRSLAEKALQVTDRRYPCVCAPTEDGKVDIFLTGDRSTIHELTASRMDKRLERGILHSIVDVWESQYGGAASSSSTWTFHVDVPRNIADRDYKVIR